MVKNTHGGNSSKSLARKSFQTSSRPIRTPESSLEMLAYVNKLFSNGLQVYIANNPEPMFCHLRGKFKGRNKSSNIITANSIVLIGLREWEAPNYKSCDLLEVYNADEIRSLESMSNIYLPQGPVTKTAGTSMKEDTITFSNDVEDTSYQPIIECNEPLHMGDDEMVDFEDI